MAVTAGASAPEHLVQELIEFLRDSGFHQMEEIELVDEDVRFSLPAELTIRSNERAVQVGEHRWNPPPRRPMRRAARYLAGLQARDGHWCAELTADTTLESDYILFQLWLYPPRRRRSGCRPRGRGSIRPCARSWRASLPDGGFNIYVKGPSEVSASVKAYFALKLAGLPVDDPRMRALRERILELGGIRPPIATSRSTSACSIFIRGNTAPAFHRKSCCYRSISSTRCPPGRGPSWSRSPSCTRPIRAVRCRGF